MYHYFVKVPSWREALTLESTITDRLEYFNDRYQHLLYDSGDETEKRFIFVSEKRITDNMRKELKDIFETAVQTEAISVKTVNRKTLKQIHIAKSLMVSNDYNGEQKSLLVTDSHEQLLEKVNGMIGFTKFKDFFKNFADYIDRTAGVRAKCLYNTVIINNVGVSLDTHVELLFSLLSTKGLILEHSMITGSKWEARSTEKETRFVYYIDDEWISDDDGEYYRASDEVKLLDRISRSDNIYITAMNQDQYDKISVLDCFKAAFPNTATIDEFTPDEKLDYICSISADYGYSVNRESFTGGNFINTADVVKIEMLVRQAVMRKLSANDKTFCLEASDIDIKTRKIKKTSSFAELEGLIGLDGVKQTIREITAFAKKRKNALPCLHMCFTGNPGTGKTSVARILARIFYESGIIKQNLLLETDREGLVGGYVGQTALKTSRKIEGALGGVLFIDEAYSLFTGGNIDYGYEAVATLVKAMEDRRTEFVCILAGYTKEMNDMINMNPGLRDRVQFYIDFPDYSAMELLQIFEKLCKDCKYKISEPARDTLLGGFTRLCNSKSQNFSNGRLVRKIFERTRMKQALRTSGNTIADTDIEAVFSEPDIAALFGESKSKQIGFRA